jgi:catechol-2,3-dioxygenase
MHSPIITLSSVEIPVSDLKRAIGWYEQALGYSCTWADQHHAMLVNENNASSTKIFLVETNDALRLEFRSTHTGIMHSAIDFETDDLEKAHAHLASFVPGLEAIPQPANEWAPRGFGFHDSEGNRLAIFSFGKK